VAFCGFANISFRRFHHLIFTLRFHTALEPAPSASDGKGQEDQAYDRILNLEFIAYSKSNPGKVNMGSGGTNLFSLHVTSSTSFGL